MGEYSDVWAEMNKSAKFIEQLVETEVKERGYADDAEISRKQVTALKRILRIIFETDAHCSTSLDIAKEHEFKRLEVKKLAYGALSVATDVGRIGDEGTYASLLCRQHRHFFIGKAGGFSCVFMSKDKTRTRTGRGINGVMYGTAR